MTDQRRIARRQKFLGQTAERQAIDLLMKAAARAQSKARHIRTALHLAEQLAQQRLHLLHWTCPGEDSPEHSPAQQAHTKQRSHRQLRGF